MEDEKFGIRKLIGKIAQNGRNKNYIVINRVTPFDTASTGFVDVRMFFTGPDDEIHPSQRGIRIYEDIAVDVVATILGALTHEELDAVLEKVARAARC